MRCIYNKNGCVQLGREEILSKTRIPRLWGSDVEEALSREPLLIYEQDADGEARYVYYGETARNRLLAIVVTER